MSEFDSLRSSNRLPHTSGLLALLHGLLIAGCSLAAAAQSTFDRQAYIGVGVGRASFSTTAEQGADFEVAGESNGSINLSLGRDFYRRFTGELVFADIGDVSLADGSRAEFTDISLSGLFYLIGAKDRRDGFAAYARAGIGELKVANNPGFERENDVHPLGGIGLEYTLSSGISIRADYILVDSDVEYATLGLLYRIGVDEPATPVSTTASVIAESPPADDTLESVDRPAGSLGTAPSISEEPAENSSLAGATSTDAFGQPDTAAIERVESPDAAVELMDTSRDLIHPCEPDGCALLTDRFSGVTFQIGSATLTAESIVLLDDVAELMNAHTDLSLRLEAHTDNSGDSAQNLELSKQRALVVYQHLASREITVDRVSARAFGGARPIADNNTPEGRRANRRVDLIFSQ
ncbi:MAG: OmpA family protein [Granulosicoccus sp.]